MYALTSPHGRMSLSYQGYKLCDVFFFPSKLKVDDMASHLQLHFILFPLLAQGHMIPMIDIARLLAKRGVIVTIVTTPRNAARFTAVIARARESGLQIKLEQVHFPFEAAGLPEGCENLDMLPSNEMASSFMIALSLLHLPAEKLLQELTPRPSCIISDMYFPWTANLATKFHIPRISFNGFSSFCILCLHNIRNSNVLDSIGSESECFVVPGLQEHVEFTKAQVRMITCPNNLESQKYLDKILAAEKVTYGMIINTFEELEPAYVKEYKKVRADKAWSIGPVSLYNKDTLDKIQRGNKASIDEHECLRWLDLQQPGSVIYACLGSLSNLTPSQMIELGLGLEASRKPFIWVLRAGDQSKALEKWILEYGFAERIRERGLLIRGWAPQVLILSHQAIGGFLTHCGWNSTLEAITMGVPMVTWPLFGDQFINEKLVVRVLKIGVSVGVEVPMQWGEEEKVGVLVKKEDVNNAINRLMDEDEEGDGRRRRARELREMAKRSIEEGGSSHHNLTMLIEAIMLQV
ncbi:UDP-glycosyltransferase 73C6-like isoform X1 [Tripterygium wilfordii]|uniref:UDP-glycosyltransferase 73C6-like isoform X1 n=2 Tax=Tripterygium wilfordii TaxID=458696 RepID=UPI0018F80CBE|nr:UDP-glycosyltransferase 73C6-like isoform X1 [Tripterygium wilfordii]